MVRKIDAIRMILVELLKAYERIGSKGDGAASKG